MNIIGIIAEYNPFHNGHAYQIACAKKAVRCGRRRGGHEWRFYPERYPAVFHKESRANMALSCGADLVIELPVLASTASAEGFALGAVRALDSLGVVNQLLFGCETDQIELFYRSASLLGDESEDFRFRLRSHIRSGNSYPQARAAAFPKEIPSGFLDTPNNILGVEYVKALLRLSSPMVPVCLRRRGSQHHDQSPSGNFLSAGALRQKIEISQNAQNPSLPCIPIFRKERMRSAIKNGQKGNVYLPMISRFCFMIGCTRPTTLLSTPTAAKVCPPKYADSGIGMYPFPSSANCSNPKT